MTDITPLNPLNFVPLDQTTVPTVQIRGEDGQAVIINESDFDPDEHELFNVPTKKTTRSQSPTPSPSPAPAPTPAPVPTPTPTEDNPAATRTEQLEQLFETEGYQAITALAEPLGVTKPSKGWKAAIPLIVEAELKNG